MFLIQCFYTDLCHGLKPVGFEVWLTLIDPICRTNSAAFGTTALISEINGMIQGYSNWHSFHSGFNRFIYLQSVVKYCVINSAFNGLSFIFLRTEWLPWLILSGKLVHISKHMTLSILIYYRLKCNLILYMLLMLHRNNGLVH